MREDNVNLVVDCRVERRQGKSVVSKVTVTEHVDQQWNDQRPQHIAVSVT